MHGRGEQLTARLFSFHKVEHEAQHQAKTLFSFAGTTWGSSMLRLMREAMWNEDRKEAVCRGAGAVHLARR